MSESNRLPLTIRLTPQDRDDFYTAAAAAGLEPGVAGRQIVELILTHLRRNPGADYVSALATLNVALGSPARSRAA